MHAAIAARSNARTRLWLVQSVQCTYTINESYIEINLPNIYNNWYIKFKNNLQDKQREEFRVQIVSYIGAMLHVVNMATT